MDWIIFITFRPCSDCLTATVTEISPRPAGQLSTGEREDLNLSMGRRLYGAPCAVKTLFSCLAGCQQENHLQDELEFNKRGPSDLLAC